jgi:hypothetical protein
MDLLKELAGIAAVIALACWCLSISAPKVGGRT